LRFQPISAIRALKGGSSQEDSEASRRV
jgi:hypothetical protein